MSILSNNTPKTLTIEAVSENLYLDVFFLVRLTDEPFGSARVRRTGPKTRMEQTSWCRRSRSLTEDAVFVAVVGHKAVVFVEKSTIVPLTLGKPFLGVLCLRGML